MRQFPQPPRADKGPGLTLPWAIVLAAVILVVGGVGGYFLLTSSDRACDDFREAVEDRLKLTRAVSPELVGIMEGNFYSSGEVTTLEGEKVEKPEGCRPV